MPYREVIHDLILNSYSKKWMLKRDDQMKPSQISKYMEKAPLVQVDYTESKDYMNKQLFSDAERFKLKFQPNLAQLKKAREALAIEKMGQEKDKLDGKYKEAFKYRINVGTLDILKEKMGRLNAS